MYCHVFFYESVKKNNFRNILFCIASKRKKKYIPLCAAPSIASPPSINEEASLRVIIETASTRPLGLKLKTKDISKCQKKYH